MAKQFVIVVEPKVEQLDKRIQIPAPTWQLIEDRAKEDGVDPQEVIRQGMLFLLSPGKKKIDPPAPKSKNR